MDKTFVEDFSKYTDGELLQANPFVYETADLIFLVKELQNRLQEYESSRIRNSYGGW